MANEPTNPETPAPAQDADRWRHVRDLFDRVLGEPPDARAAAAGALTPDGDVAREVLALLEIHDRDDAHLESGPGLFLWPHSEQADNGDDHLPG